MPYVVIEASSSLNPSRMSKELLPEVNRIIAESFRVDADKIKTIARRGDEWLVGQKRPGAYLYLTLHCFAGRPAEMRARASLALHDFLRHYAEREHADVSTSVYVVELDQSTATTQRHRPTALPAAGS